VAPPRECHSAPAPQTDASWGRATPGRAAHPERSAAVDAATHRRAGTNPWRTIRPAETVAAGRTSSPAGQVRQTVRGARRNGRGGRRRVGRAFCRSVQRKHGPQRGSRRRRQGRSGPAAPHRADRPRRRDEQVSSQVAGAVDHRGRGLGRANGSDTDAGADARCDRRARPPERLLGFECTDDRRCDVGSQLFGATSHWPSGRRIARSSTGLRWRQATRSPSSAAPRRRSAQISTRVVMRGGGRLRSAAWDCSLRERGAGDGEPADVPATDSNAEPMSPDYFVAMWGSRRRQLPDRSRDRAPVFRFPAGSSAGPVSARSSRPGRPFGVGVARVVGCRLGAQG